MKVFNYVSSIVMDKEVVYNMFTRLFRKYFVFFEGFEYVMVVFRVIKHCGGDWKE